MATVRKPGTIRTITEHYAGDDQATYEFVIGDVLHDQEVLYQSIMGARTNGTCEHNHYHHGESSSGTVRISRASDDQIATDFEYARLLQEMEDLTIDTPPNDSNDEQDDISCVASPSETDDDDDDNEDEAARQDDDDDDYHNHHNDDDDNPDNMTYEQGESLVESVGNEGRGLSDELISYLVPSKYKSGFFARKTNYDDCTICLSAFKNRESLIILPCKHNYHAGCIAKWLKINKTCPVCKYEVFGPS